jgi:hypothetical protein
VCSYIYIYIYIYIYMHTHSSVATFSNAALAPSVFLLVVLNVIYRNNIK